MATPEETVPRMKGSRNRSSQAANPYGEMPPDDSGIDAPFDPPDRPAAGPTTPVAAAPIPADEPVVNPAPSDEGGGDGAIAAPLTTNPLSGSRRGQSDSDAQAFDPVDVENNHIDSEHIIRSREVVKVIEERGRTGTPLTTAEISTARDFLRAASRDGAFSVGWEDSSEKRRFRIWNEIVNGTVSGAERVDGQPGDNSFLFSPDQWYETAHDANPGTSLPKWETLKTAIQNQIGILYAEWKLTDVTSTDVGKRVAAQNYNARREKVSLAIANDFSNLLNAHAETGAKEDGHYSQKAIYDMMSLDLGEGFGEGVTGVQAGNMHSVRVRGIRQGMRLAQEQANLRNLGELDDPFVDYAERQAAESPGRLTLDGTLVAHGASSDAPAPNQGADAAPKGTAMSSDKTTSETTPDSAATARPAAPSGLPPRSIAVSSRPQAAPPPPAPPGGEAPSDAASPPTDQQTPPAAGVASTPGGESAPTPDNTGQTSSQPAGSSPASGTEAGGAPHASAPGNHQAAPAPKPVSIPSAAATAEMATSRYEQQGATERGARMSEEERIRREKEAEQRRLEAARQQSGGQPGGGSGGSSFLGGAFSGLGQGIGNVFRGLGQGVGAMASGSPADKTPAEGREAILREMSPSMTAARSNFAEGLAHIDSIHSQMLTLKSRDAILEKHRDLQVQALAGVSSTLFPDDPTKMVREMEAAGGDISKLRYPDGKMKDMMVKTIEAQNALVEHRHEAAPQSLELQKSAAMYANGVTAAADYLSKEGDLNRNGDSIKGGLDQGAKNMEEIGNIGKSLRENTDTMPEAEAVEKKFESAKKAMAEVVRKIMNMIRALFGRAPVAGPNSPAPAPAP